MTATLGIDPGLTGALAIVEGERVEVHDMPVHEVKGKSRLDLHTLGNRLRILAVTYDIRVAVIEDVHSMPAQGIASAFTFGFTAGATQALVASAQIPMRLVSPGAWKRVLGLGRDKDESRRLASRIFPQHAHLWARKKDDGRAEAALLAHYGRLS